MGISTGAKLGAAAALNPALALGAVTSAPKLLGGIGSALAGSTGKVAKARKAAMEADVARLKSGKLGMTDAEKQKALQQATSAIHSQTAGTRADIQRQAAAQGGFGTSGMQQSAIGDVAEAETNAAAAEQAKIDALSQALAKQREAEIRGRMDQWVAEKKADWATIGQGAGEAAQNVASMAVGAPPGLSPEALQGLLQLQSGQAAAGTTAAGVP